ncbi:MAG TPA: sialate O-acetylesterase, partial [Opitutaceae bacterium]|nr:sialate O-acetylesterase [Opitutaceae bacterium]
LDPTADHFTLLHFIAALPGSREPIRLVVRRGTPITYPIAFIVQIPAAHLSDASWIQDETEESDPIDWAKSAPQAGAVPAVTHVFLLIGQSNMAGRGPVGAEDRTPDPRVFALGQDRQWHPAVDPLAFDKPELVGVGPGLAFGKAVARAHPDWVVGLVLSPFGGSSLDEWRPGGRLYGDAIARAQAALAGGGRLEAILWHQGESDAKPELAMTYVARFQLFAASLRHDLGAPAVPLIAGEIGRFVAGGESINRQLALLPSAVPHCRLVSSAGLTDKGDHLHFDSPSARELGRRYAAAFAAGADR